MFGALGLPELLVILAIIVLLFGVGRVSKIGKELGSAVGSFRKGLNEGNEEENAAKSKDSSDI